MAVKESKMRITISMDKELHERIKAQSEKEMRSISSLINFATTKYLEEQEEKK